MPYGTRKSGKMTQVFNKKTGKVYGSHSSKAKANKQLAALHIHTNEGAPAMSEVFVVKEAPVSNRPPPGSKPIKPTDWTGLGQIGQNLKKGLEGMKMAGQEMNAYATPQGDRIAFPKDAAPGRPPLKADDTKGIWAPQTGSAGTTTTPTTMTTTMK